MPTSSVENIAGIVKANAYKASSGERAVWDKSDLDTRSLILSEEVYASENAYQLDSTAKYNQTLNTNYDSLSESVKGLVHESLVGQGILPNPSDSIGIGLQYVANPYATEKEVFIECDRCDEVFMDEEDFDNHKSFDHGDKPLDNKESEEGYTLALNPEMTREALRDARKTMAETSQKTLRRSHIFNGSEIPEPTISEPDNVKGIVGYNDNPNEGLYDTKRFVKAPSSTRHDALEAYAAEKDLCPICKAGQSCEDLISHARYWDTDDAKEGDFWKNNSNFEVDTDELEKSGRVVSKQPDDKRTYESHADIQYVKPEPQSKSDESLDKSLENIDISETPIEYVFQTKAAEAVIEKETAIEGYNDDLKESDDEAVESQVIDRKLRGYSDESIANELAIMYGVSPDDAMSKVNSVEVSTNDKVAMTFYGKRYGECTESELAELRLYSGSVDE